MNQALIDSYKSILALFVKATEDDPLDIIKRLESLKDPTEDVREQFTRLGGNPPLPLHWISLLRVIRMSISLIAELRSRYEAFVTFYSKFREKKSQTKDEQNLYKEIGDFLYKVDDLIGIHERLTVKFVTDIRSTLLNDFGVIENPEREYYRSKIKKENMDRIEDDARELYSICRRCVEEIRIMHGLDRLQRLFK
jgi:hypothetical protein